MSKSIIDKSAIGLRFDIIFLSLAILSVLASLGLIGCDTAKSEAQNAFKTASSALDTKNAEVDAAIADLQDVINSEIKPLDDNTTKAAQETISAAQGAKVIAPQMANDTDAIKEQVSELEKVDYKAQLESIAKAKAALENSIKQREQITNPSEEFVIQRLTSVENVSEPTALTEERDENNLLHKQGGYSAKVYFACDLIDQSTVNGDDVIDKGIHGGGAIEVYPDEDGAQKRSEYIANYDGTILKPGSHNVYGTCVIRISDNLTASQQKELESAIVEALTRLE